MEVADWDNFTFVACCSVKSDYRMVIKDTCNKLM